MDEGGGVAALVDVLEIDYEFRGVVLGVREHLGAVKRDDVVGDDLDGLGREVLIVDTEVRVEPVDFICDKFAWDEALWIECQQGSYATKSSEEAWRDSARRLRLVSRNTHLRRNMGLNLCTLLVLALEDRRRVTRDVLNAMNSRLGGRCALTRHWEECLGIVDGGSHARRGLWGRHRVRRCLGTVKRSRRGCEGRGRWGETSAEK